MIRQQCTLKSTADLISFVKKRSAQDSVTDDIISAYAYSGVLLHGGVSKIAVNESTCIE